MGCNLFFRVTPSYNVFLPKNRKTNIGCKGYLKKQLTSALQRYSVHLHRLDSLFRAQTECLERPRRGSGPGRPARRRSVRRYRWPPHRGVAFRSRPLLQWVCIAALTRYSVSGIAIGKGRSCHRLSAQHFSCALKR